MTATEKHSKKPRSLWAFIETLTNGEIQSARDADPPWFEEGTIAQIDEKTYWYFLELLVRVRDHSDCSGRTRMNTSFVN